MAHLYAIGFGSNRRHGRYGAPEQIIQAALAALASRGVTPLAVSPTIRTTPLGPGGRRYANAAALVETAHSPPELLAMLKQIEGAFGRRRGRRWGMRVLDLDILLWSGGRWAGRRPMLDIPHKGLAGRRFVLDPLLSVAPDWRVPGRATVRQLRARLTRPAPLHRD